MVIIQLLAVYIFARSTCLQNLRRFEQHIEARYAITRGRTGNSELAGYMRLLRR
jgi:hypothetical protein